MNQHKRNILLTFDYELFLGHRSGTADNCLIKPTRMLLKTLESGHLKAIFFIDILYLYRLSTIKEKYKQAAYDFEAVTGQIREMAALGHYVYLHVHPHWLDAVYVPEKNEWDLGNTSRFSISNLPEAEAERVLVLSLQTLRTILEAVPEAHPIEGFRAGGLFIQPFSRFSSFLKSNRIPYEFSVYPLFKSSSKVCEVDFSKVPDERIYHFENDCCIKQTNGYFTEYTISEISFSGYKRVINSIWFRANQRVARYRPSGDGTGAAHVLANNNKKVGIKDIVRETAAVELMNNWKNKIYMEYLAQNRLLHFLSHPKLISEGHLHALHHFIQKAEKKYHLVSDFKSFLHD